MLLTILTFLSLIFSNNLELFHTVKAYCSAKRPVIYILEVKYLPIFVWFYVVGVSLWSWFGVFSGLGHPWNMSSSDSYFLFVFCFVRFSIIQKSLQDRIHGCIMGLIPATLLVKFLILTQIPHLIRFHNVFSIHWLFQGKGRHRIWLLKFSFIFGNVEAIVEPLNTTGEHPCPYWYIWPW